MQMEIVVSKRVTNIKNPQLRLEAYLDLVELISYAYGENAGPMSSYLIITAEREEIPEEKYLGNQPVEKIREYLKQVKVIGIESSIPVSFDISSRLWYTKGEGVVMYGREVSLSCPNLDTDEIMNLQKLVKKSSNDYVIEIAGKRIYGGS